LFLARNEPKPANKSTTIFFTLGGRARTPAAN